MLGMAFDLILRGGEIATSQHIQIGDVGIKDGKIAEIGNLAQASAQQIVDVRGLTVIPGVIDTQVHFREPGMEHKEDIESGTRAAVAGGVTTVFEMPNTNPSTTTKEALEDKIRRARGRAWCNIAFFVGAATDNAEQLGDLEMLPGTPGIKIFMGSSTGSLLVASDEDVRRVLQHGKRRCPVHSEDHFRLEERKSLISPDPSVHDHPFLRDAEAARQCTERLLRLSEETGRPVHVLHLSTADEIPLLWNAKKRGVDVTVEITPQHLWFAAPEAYDRLGTLAQMNPPIRTEEHRQALRQALKDGLFSVIGSDHAPHTLAEKAQPYPKSPSGMPGVQTLLQAMLTLADRDGLLSFQEFIRLACEAPAELYGVSNKGRLETGFDADLAILDRKKPVTFERSMVQSKCGWSPFEGETFTSSVKATVVGGRIVYREGEMLGPPSGTQPRFVWK
jgi:dihydroorotase